MMDKEARFAEILKEAQTAHKSWTKKQGLPGTDPNTWLTTLNSTLFHTIIDLEERVAILEGQSQSLQDQISDLGFSGRCL